MTTPRDKLFQMIRQCRGVNDSETLSTIAAWLLERADKRELPELLKLIEQAEESAE